MEATRREIKRLECHLAGGGRRALGICDSRTLPFAEAAYFLRWVVRIYCE
jgi:hypothetical protein